MGNIDQNGCTEMIGSENSNTGLNRRRDICFWSLCASVFLTGVFNGTFQVLAFEWIFIYIYIVLLRPLPSIMATIRQNQAVFGLAVLWGASVTVSLLTSPLHLSNEPAAVIRYVQTLSHVVFFLFVRNFIGQHPISLRWPLLAIPLSVVVVSAVMSFLLYGEDLTSADTANRWFGNHPLNAHMRHTGYLITAGIGIMIGFCLSGHERAANRSAVLLLLIVLFTFLFWTGGRGAVLSVVFAFAATGLVVWIKGGSVRFLGIAFIVSLFAGLVLSELLAVFPWNGVLQMVFRSIQSQDLGQLSTGRIDIWRSAWDSVKDHLVFGLGPHGYYFMPNRIFGVQPHSVVLQFLVEWGGVGALLFTTLLAIGFYRGLREHVLDVKINMNPTRIAAGALILALAVHGLYDGTFFHPQPSLYLAFCFAVWSSPRQRVSPASALGPF